ncbi:MAG: DUF1611 domain-containing protein [Ignavibacteriae bacterium]|nr:DUF1611 domain-containing protein [Ignavibacteriota bacterium]
MSLLPEGNAIIYSEKVFNTPAGKTANGLVRFTERYKIISVIDSNYAGQDSGMVLNNKENNIPIFASLKDALSESANSKLKPTHFIVGTNPKDGKLDDATRDVVKSALKKGLNVDSGLNDFLSEDKELKTLATQNEVSIRDIRKPAPRSELHSFAGKIEEVDSFIIAVLGTDSTVGKRTTAWLLVHALRTAGYKAEFIGTGQTAWMQGAKYGIILDSIVNNFVNGELENVIYKAWKNEKPNFIVIEGQGGLLNPANPSGFEILTCGRPAVIVLQHSPTRKEYIGFPDYSIHPLSKQMKAIEVISGKQIAAITINHENLNGKEIDKVCGEYSKLYDIPTYDVLTHGADKLVKTILKHKK